MASSTHELPSVAGVRDPAGTPHAFRVRLRRLNRDLRRSKQAIMGLTIVGILVVLAAAAPILAPADPGKPNLSESLQSPSLSHPFGTDELGRDILGRIIHGARVSLIVAGIAVGISLLGGVPIGVISGYWQGAIGSVLMRLMDAIQAFPGVLLAIAIASTLGPGITNAMIAIGIVGIPTFARLSRGEVLRLRSVEFVNAAISTGAGSTRVLSRHILPNGVAPVIVAIATSCAGAILTEASLSFVGLGAAPPNPSWGSMLQSGYPFMQIAPWLSIFPGLAIAVTTLGFIFLGDGLRDILDPRLRGR
ncbi:MAG TPA: ABC transporter permease [Thermomicrobiales bacterium]|nr:ABC transporter permease [Thermomicrobiales bacterium]